MTDLLHKAFNFLPACNSTLYTMFDIHNDIAAVFITALILILVKRYTGSTQVDSFAKGLPYPPGPKPWPVIGNMYDMPTANSWLTYTKWQKLYGDIFHLRVFNTHIIVVNSTKVASDLFDKRSRLYSDRPIFPLSKMMGWDFSTVLLPYGSRWRAQRRLLDQSFRPQAASVYRPLQLQKIREYLRGLLRTPSDFELLTRSLSAAIIMKATYGYDVDLENDHYVNIAEEAISMISNASVPGATLVNTLPILRYIPEWVPGAGFQKIAGKCRELVTEMHNEPFEFARNNADIPCIVNTLLNCDGDVKAGVQEREELVKHIATTSYAAGADTTVSATASAILALVLYPQKAKKAQAEIDKVIGNSRLPDYSDRPSLPYIEAFYREVMRWRPVLPLSVIHSTSDSDIYQDYFIPKGALIVGNIWAMTRDENKYVDPDTFNPDRFFTLEGKLNGDSDILAFGFGRRVCVGKPLGDATVWATIASLLAVFDFGKARDEKGNIIEVDGRYSGGMISHPLPFKCSITPRSGDARKLILESANRDI